MKKKMYLLNHVIDAVLTFIEKYHYACYSILGFIFNTNPVRKLLVISCLNDIPYTTDILPTIFWQTLI